MRSPWVFALALLLAVPGFTLGPARADATLVVDAGLSVVAYDGAILPVTAGVAGGTPPYTVSWTRAGSSAGFADPAAASTTFSTAGLSSGVTTLHVTVTDAASATASDTVSILTGTSLVLADASVAVPAGVPDERAGGASPDRKAVGFLVPSGLGRIEGTLSWPDPLSDLDFDLVPPSSVSASGSQGRTQANPERATVLQPQAAMWQLLIRPVVSAGTTAHARVVGYPLGTLPVADAGAPITVGTLDVATVAATASGGAGPYDFAWDLDGDGVYETAGAAASLTLPVGEHAVGVKVTDASGFEVGDTATITVLPHDRVQRYVCGGDPTRLWAMEFTASRGTCWLHGGHHTYFFGGRTLAFQGVHGIAFAVEQQFAPPAEPTYAPEYPMRSPLHVSVSMDGLSWTEVGVGRYQLLPDPLNPSGNIQRQYVSVDIPGDGEPMRYLRFHSPLSASQGLSGYLDHTEGMIVADERSATPADVSLRTRALSCEAHILEDFFDTHPCTYGGIDRYDAPSFFHTYPLGDVSQLSQVSGRFTLLPWRLDDWHQGNTSANRTGVSAMVQTSVDGVEWMTLGDVVTRFGESTTFSFPVPDAEARFVRLFPQYHARYDLHSDPACNCAANHHPKGYFTDSAVTVTGLLPET